MKVEEKRVARGLRKSGLSINEICKKLGVAKSSVSIWVRDVSLTKEQLKGLSERGQRKEVVEKRRATRLSNERARRQIIIDSALNSVSELMNNSLFLSGISLYWGEGSKTKRSVVEFANTDPEMIRVMMKFFREVCCVPEEKFRGRVLIHSHLAEGRSVDYWSNISGIPRKQFYKVSHQRSKATRKKRDSLIYGTFSIYVCDTELFLKIRGWTQGVVKQLEAS